MGKSAFLKAIALSCLGPTVRDSGIVPYRFVRRELAAPRSSARVPGREHLGMGH